MIRAQRTVGEFFIESVVLSLKMAVMLAPFMIAWGLYLEFQSRSFIDSSERAEGQVFFLDVRRGGDRIYVRPMFSVVLEGGREIEVEEIKGSHNYNYSYNNGNKELGWFNPELEAFKLDSMIAEDQFLAKSLFWSGVLILLSRFLWASFPWALRLARGKVKGLKGMFLYWRD